MDLNTNVGEGIFTAYIIFVLSVKTIALYHKHWRKGRSCLDGVGLHPSVTVLHNWLHLTSYKKSFWVFTLPRFPQEIMIGGVVYFFPTANLHRAMSSSCSCSCTKALSHPESMICQNCVQAGLSIVVCLSFLLRGVNVLAVSRLSVSLPLTASLQTTKQKTNQSESFTVFNASFFRNKFWPLIMDDSNKKTKN